MAPRGRRARDVARSEADMAEQFAQPNLLVTPEWLHAHLDDPAMRIVDTRAAKAYAEGHIAGAVPLDVYSLNVTDTSAAGMQAWIAKMEEAFSAAGIGEGQTLVFYEDVSGQFSTRGLWALAYFGNDNGRLLDGGLKAWQAAGYPLSTAPAQATRTSFRARPRPELVATYEDVLRGIEDQQTRIVDTRRESEYLGTEIRAPRGGRIPGAVFLEWVHNLDPSGKFKSPAELAALY